MSLPGSQFRSGSGNPSVGNALSNASGTVLTRLSQSSPFSSGQGGPLTSLQAQVDGLVTHFVEEAANPRTLAALMAGGLAYRFGRIGVMAAGEGYLGAGSLRTLSVGLGLGTEVTAFELANRSMSALSGDSSNPNLWRWNGQGGWAQGLLSSTITFGMLKGAGFLGREQNVIFQHAFQSTAMVAGHNTAGLLGITSRPEGTLAEQLLHAEATNLQLGAGMSLSHSFAPGLHALERGLDLSLQSWDVNAVSRLRGLLGPDPRLATATASEGSSASAPTRPRSARDPRSAHIMMMTTGGNDGNGGEKKPGTPSTPLDDARPRSPGVEEDLVSAPTIRVDLPESAEFDEEPRTAQDEVPAEVRFHPAATPPAEETAVPVAVPIDLPAPLSMVPTKASAEKTPIPEVVRDPGAHKVVVPQAVVAEGEVVIPPATLSPEELAVLGPKVVVEDQYASSVDQARLISRSMRPSTPPSIRIKEGDLLAGKYKITDRRPLGAGGFGEVWRAEDIELGRQVALKVIKRERLEGEDDEARLDEYIRRFEREIKIGANLNPQHSATVYEIRKLDNGTTILVMELLSGHDLSALRNGIARNDPTITNRFPMERRLEIFMQICEALGSAHRRGFVHMDLKPDNIRVTEEGHVRIMDWGQARGLGDATHDSGKRIPLEVLQELRQNLTMDGSISGTPGYIAPERFLGKALINPRSPDIFAMGIILYEWVTGVHPFATFIQGDPADGEAPQVVVRDKNGLTMINYLSTAPGIRKPFPFSQVMAGERPVFLREVERIALKAMNQNPALRYQSAAEMRDDVILASARTDRDLIFGDRTKQGLPPSIREEMKLLEKEMNGLWNNLNLLYEPEGGQWDLLHRPMRQLKQKRADMIQKANDLEIHLIQIMPSLSNPNLAKKMIADVTWRRLLYEGDRIAEPVRNALMDRIRKNDVKTSEEPLRGYAEAIDSPVRIELSPIDFKTRQPLPDSMRVRIIPYMRERDEQGEELENFHETKDQAISSTLSQLRKGLVLKAGYYALEVSNPGYVTMRVPFHLRWKDVREALIKGESFRVDLELVPQELLQTQSGEKIDMVIVHGGRAVLGHDFYHDGTPTNLYARPMKKINFRTFATSRAPVSVGEFKTFVESLVQDLNDHLKKRELDQARNVIKTIRDVLPQARLGPLEKGSATWDAGKDPLSRAFLDETFNWKIDVSGDEENPQFLLRDFKEYADLHGDPIASDQPISFINYFSAEAYTQWASKRDGLPYQIISADQKEIISRNSFEWTFPWGYEFNPSFILTRLAFHDPLKNAYPRAIGYHPKGPEKYRDYSLYGNDNGPILDILGNVREFTSSAEEPDTMYLSGGSVRSPFGVLFLPPARPYMTKSSWSEHANGGFRLVLELPSR